MTDNQHGGEHGGGEVVSFAEKQAQAQAAATAAARAQARQQARRDGAPESKPWLTWSLIGVNILVWVVMVGVGVHAYQPTADALLTWGGNLGVLVGAGEWWRLLSAMFLHAGIIHLGFNLYFLWIIGRVTEQIFGPAAYALVYFGSGLIASLVSAIWQPAIVSVGASGALFGVFGAFVAFTIQRREVLPPDFVRSVRRNALILIGLNIAIGLAVPGIDLAAHIGGLIGGLGIGYGITKLAEKPVATPSEARSVRRRAIGSTAVATVVVILAGSFAVPRDQDPSVIEAVGQRHDDVLTAYRALEDVDARVAMLEHEVLPMLRESEAAVAKIDRPSPQLEKFERYFELRTRAFERELDALRNDDPSAFAEAQALHAEAVAIMNGGGGEGEGGGEGGGESD